MDASPSPPCRTCGTPYAPARAALGIDVCMPCGDAAASKVIRTIVPMHKSNYVPITNLEDLKGINNKGGFYR